MRLIPQQYLYLCTFCLLISAGLQSQPLPDSTRTRIDQLFKEWDNQHSPGCAIGIVKGDSLIYAKGYGMANLEYGVPNTPHTLFQLASVSKQFTAYCIVLLAREGKLNLNDDIHKYLPDFPDLHEHITILNLLTHTSGIRDYFTLMQIAGKQEDEISTQEEVVRLLHKQQALNFKPGTAFLYSNSNFTLLAEIVKSVSGKSFRQFADSAIFKPLKMDHTHVHDKYTEIDPGRSYSYTGNGPDSWSNRLWNCSTIGSTGLYTNVNDFGKWVSNFFHPKAGDLTAIAQLTETKVKLLSGADAPYALGIMSKTYNGYRIWTHNGSDAGYRTLVMIFPDQKMGVYLFSNNDGIPVADKLHAVADLMLNKNTYTVPVPEPEWSDTSKAVLSNPAKFGNYMGSYVDEQGTLFRFSMHDNKIHWQGNGVSRLMKAEGDTVTIFAHSDSKMVFSVDPVKHDTLMQMFWTGNHRTFYKLCPDISFTDQQLLSYTGTYHSPELDCNYYLKFRNHQVYLSQSEPGESIILFKGKDELLSEFWWIPALKMRRNAKGQITGFEVNAGRVQHLRFDKVK